MANCIHPHLLDFNLRRVNRILRSNQASFSIEDKGYSKFHLLLKTLNSFTSELDFFTPSLLCFTKCPDMTNQSIMSARVPIKKQPTSILRH